MLAALKLEVDGSRAGTEAEGHRVAYKQAFSETGLHRHWSKPDFGRLTISGDRERLRHHFEPRIRNNDLLLPRNPAQFIENLYQRNTRYFASLAETGRLLPRPGISRIITEAKKADLILAIPHRQTKKRKCNISLFV